MSKQSTMTMVFGRFIYINFLLSILVLVATSTIPIEVYDNVLEEEMSLRLHEACSASDEEDAVFQFPLNFPSRHNYIEQVLNDVIGELYGPHSSFFVEYWTRQKWIHSLAHQDMDEGLREQDESLDFRHPKFGHVIYLKLGSNVQGPTCVFNATRGGEITESAYLYVVPAKEGRVLKFQGDLLHAVPRPGDLWLHPRMDPLVHEPSDVWGRSVLLFNLWPTNKPMLVDRTLSLPMDCEKEEDCPSVEPKKCNSFDGWEQREVNDLTIATSDLDTRIEFPLMGDERRRGTESYSVVLETSKSAYDAFANKDRPSRLLLRKWVKKRRPWLSFMGFEL